MKRSGTRQADESESTGRKRRQNWTVYVAVFAPRCDSQQEETIVPQSRWTTDFFKGDSSSPVTSWADHLDVVSPVDRHQRSPKQADHQRTVRFREAPFIYQRSFAGAARDWFALEHLVGSCDWNHPLQWIETLFTRRRSTLVEDLWCHLG